MSQIVKLPDLGGDSPLVAEVLVEIGDKIEEGASLLSLESDKAAMEVPSPFSGQVESILVKVGDKVESGAEVLKIATEGAPKTTSTEATATETASTKTITTPKQESGKVAPTQNEDAKPTAHTPSLPEGGNIYSSPSARKFAREKGVDITRVCATGLSGRITLADVAEYLVANAGGGGVGLPSAPLPNFANFGEIEVKPMSKLQSLTALQMTRSWLHVPRVTQLDEADITNTENFRQSLKQAAEKRKTKLTILSFITKAVAAALETFPQFNTSVDMDGKQLIQRNYIHIGIAVDTPRGLMVPVLRDVNQKSVWEIADEIMALSKATSEGTIKSSQMQGGCFTISSLGSIGGTHFTPIVNHPEIAILGVGRAKLTPAFDENMAVHPAQILPLSLSYDHRAVNGADGARFISFIKDALSDLRLFTMF